MLVERLHEAGLALAPGLQVAEELHLVDAQVVLAQQRRQQRVGGDLDVAEAVARVPQHEGAADGLERAEPELRALDQHGKRVVGAEVLLQPAEGRGGYVLEAQVLSAAAAATSAAVSVAVAAGGTKPVEQNETQARTESASSVSFSGASAPPCCSASSRLKTSLCAACQQLVCGHVFGGVAVRVLAAQHDIRQQRARRDEQPRRDARGRVRGGAARFLPSPSRPPPSVAGGGGGAFSSVPGGMEVELPSAEGDSAGEAKVTALADIECCCMCVCALCVRCYSALRQCASGAPRQENQLFRDSLILENSWTRARQTAENKKKPAYSADKKRGLTACPDQ